MFTEHKKIIILNQKVKSPLIETSKLNLKIVSLGCYSKCQQDYLRSKAYIISLDVSLKKFVFYERLYMLLEFRPTNI